MSRYAQDAEDEFEPGSNNLVLRNKLGITDPSEIEKVESDALAIAMYESTGWIDQDEPITSAMILRLHREWLAGIYSFAGQFRTVNVSKGGLMFCAAPYVPNQMEEFERNLLRNLTPTSGCDRLSLAARMAEVHAELIIIHPFREGNGRVSRWVTNIMAWQAGLKAPDYQLRTDEERNRYFAALRRGFAGKKEDLTTLFGEWLGNDEPERL